jgi:DnaJ like chaperone protein
MTWLGKMLGGTIGFAVGGPIGAVAGAAFGHMFDDGNTTLDLQRRNQQVLSPDESAQMAFFVGSFSMLAKLTKADGQVTKPELKSVQEFMTNDLNLNDTSRQAAENIFKAALNSSESFESFAVQFYQQFHQQNQLLELVVDILVRVSVADGYMNANEERLILSAIHIFQFNEDAYQKIKARYISDSDQYYTILGCSKTDSDAQIKSRYRTLVRDFHPDTIASKGLPEEFVTFANDKFVEIQQAYEMVKKERNL